MMEKRLLGDYQLLKQIGQGPLGSVYLAEHRFIKRQFVLKILPEEISSDRSFIQRFEKEVALLAAIEHPHLVKVHNISFSEGNYFLTMDCIVDDLGETTNLSQYLNLHHQKLKEEEIKTILFQIAEALDYLHQKQSEGVYLTHRSLKLNNILMGKGEVSPWVVVSDFGLAKILGEGMILTRTYKLLALALGMPSSVSIFGVQDKYPSEFVDTSRNSKLHQSFLQTYNFLAPEQKISSKESHLGPAVDIYAFGVLAYYLLMRRYPEGYFPLPSKYGLKKFPWDELVTSCLEPDPSKRPESLTKFFETDSVFKAIAKPIKLEKEEAAPVPVPTFVQRFEIKKEVPAAISAPAPAPTAAPAPAPQFSHTSVATAVTETIVDVKPVIKPQEIERPTYEEDPGKIFQMEMTVARYTPTPPEIKEIEPILTDMVVIQGGPYTRGSIEGGRDERPVHEIYLDSFAIDIHPVTNEQFMRFLEAMGGEKDSNNNDIIRLRESRIRRLGGKLWVESGYAKHPVTGVTWYGSVAYAKWVGKRLPTEAEWEIAARGGLSDAIYPTGKNIERNQANYFSSDTTVVLSYPPNAYGIYDLAGNVYEWCQDWYDYSYYATSSQEPENPAGPLQGVYRVLRGGCWKSLKEDLRCSYRHKNNPGTINSTYGFRLAADAS